MSNNGVFRGRTEATLEGLAKGVDQVHARIDKLPCHECIATTASVKLLWRIVLIGLSASLAGAGTVVILGH